MPELEWNKNQWESDLVWERSQGGEAWSQAWNGSSVQWEFHLKPRLHPILAQRGTILEIAPGFGRWTTRIAEYADKLHLVDYSAACIDAMRRLPLGCDNITYTKNDGTSLPGIDDKSVDFVFSYDSLVHCDWQVVESYLYEIERVLKDGGLAFIHHSNGAAVGFPEAFDGDRSRPVGPGARDMTVSGQKVKDTLGEKRDLRVLLLEFVDWQIQGWYSDCYTVLRKTCDPIDTLEHYIAAPRDRAIARNWTNAVHLPDTNYS